MGEQTKSESTAVVATVVTLTRTFCSSFICERNVQKHFVSNICCKKFNLLKPGPRQETPPTPLSGLNSPYLSLRFETVISLVEKAIIQ